MKLKENQLKLIRHLIRFNLMAYEDCLKLLDTNDSGDRMALSYAFRPLTKNRYLSKNKKGVVTVLKKGRALFPDEMPLISTATGTVVQQRIMQVSRVRRNLSSSKVRITLIMMRFLKTGLFQH